MVKSSTKKLQVAKNLFLTLLLVLLLLQKLFKTTLNSLWLPKTVTLVFALQPSIPAYSITLTWRKINSGNSLITRLSITTIGKALLEYLLLWSMLKSLLNSLLILSYTKPMKILLKVSTTCERTSLLQPLITINNSHI